MNIFSSTQKVVFDVCGAVFGNAATWTPSNGDEMQSATVLYKDPTEKHGLSDVDYNIERYQMEYLVSDFAGLKEAVGRGETERVVITNDDGLELTFIVRRTERKYDGKTIVAYLNPVE